MRKIVSSYLLVTPSAGINRYRIRRKWECFHWQSMNIHWSTVKWSFCGFDRGTFSLIHFQRSSIDRWHALHCVEKSIRLNQAQSLFKYGQRNFCLSFSSHQLKICWVKQNIYLLIFKQWFCLIQPNGFLVSSTRHSHGPGRFSWSRGVAQFMTETSQFLYLWSKCIELILKSIAYNSVNFFIKSMQQYIL